MLCMDKMNSTMKNSAVPHLKLYLLFIVVQLICVVNYMWTSH